MCLKIFGNKRLRNGLSLSLSLALRDSNRSDGVMNIIALAEREREKGKSIQGEQQDITVGEELCGYTFMHMQREMCVCGSRAAQNMTALTHAFSSPLSKTHQTVISISDSHSSLRYFSTRRNRVEGKSRQHFYGIICSQ